MKYLFFLLLLPMFLNAQKHLVCISDTGTVFTVRATAVDFVNNNVRYQIELDTVYKSDIAYCRNTWGVLDTAKIVQSDVNKTGCVLINNFGLMLLLVDNPLDLNLNKCAIKED